MNALSPRGQAAVEFAMIGPALFLLVLGVLDFGRAGFYYSGASGLARVAARDAAVANTGSGYTDSQVMSLVKVQADSMSMANLSQPAGCGTNTPPSPLTSCYQPQIGSAYIFIDRSGGTYVKASIVYAFRPTTPMLSALTGTIYLVSTATMDTEY